MSIQVIKFRSPASQSHQTLEPTSSKKESAHRGFAAMSPEQQRQIASKGGEAVSKNRGHMSEIGKKGGDRVSQNRKHMSDIGRKGGEASKASRHRE